METKYTVLYKNGATDEIILDEKFQHLYGEIANIINQSFNEEVGAVVRLGSEDKLYFIRLSEVARIIVEK